MNTNTLGNMTESIILSEFQKMEIATSIPFGRNEPYDFIIDTNQGFKAVQVKHGRYKNGCIRIAVSHKTTSKKTKTVSYKGVVDYIAVWCGYLNKAYLLDINKVESNTEINLRTEMPKNNLCISSIKWAKDYEFERVAKMLRKNV